MTEKMAQSTKYPFCALVGQEMMKEAIVLNMIDPGLGGVLIRGQKGTAKDVPLSAESGLDAGHEV